MKIEKVTIFGTGNIGSRLAYHIAYNKIDITVYDRNYGLLEEARTKFRELGIYYQNQFDASIEDTEAALANIAYSMEIKEAAGNAQLIIEAIAEDFQARKNLYSELRKTAPKNALFVTTSEALDLESFSRASGRNGRFLNLHFIGNKDSSQSVEIMVLPKTKKEVLLSVTDFLKSIGMEVSIRRFDQQK